MLRFFITVLLATLLIALITWVGEQQSLWVMPEAWMEILIFVLFITVVIYYNLNKLRAKQPEAFTQFYLLSIVLKMVGGLTLIFFIVWDDPAAAMGNVTLFIISYLILTFLEVYFLLSRSEK